VQDGSVVLKTVLNEDSSRKVRLVVLEGSYGTAWSWGWWHCCPLQCHPYRHSVTSRKTWIQGRVHVLWGVKLIQFLEPSLRKGTKLRTHVKELCYLGTKLNQTNSTHNEIHARILSGNRCYCSCGKLMKSGALNRNLKLKINKSLTLRLSD